MGEILGLSAGLFFALSSLLVQRGMRKASVSAAVTINLVINNLFYGVFVLVLFLRNGLPSFNLQGAALAAAGGICAHYFGRTFGFSSVKRIGAARSTLLMLTQTFFSFTFGIVFLREILNVFAVSGMVLVILGVFLLSREKMLQEETAATAEETSLKKNLVTQGIIFALLAGLSFSTADLLRKLGLQLIPSAVMSSTFGGLAALLIQVLVISFRQEWRQITLLKRSAWLNLLLSGITSGLAILSINAALNFAPIAIVNALFGTRIWYIIALSPLFLGAEGKITRMLIVSALIIMAGVLNIIFH